MAWKLLKRDGEYVHWTTLIFLVYVGFVFLAPLQNHAGPRELVVCFATVACFLVLYLVAFVHKGRIGVWCVAGIVLLGMLYLPYNSGAFTYFVFAGAFLGFLFSVRTAYMLLAGLITLTGIESWLLHSSYPVVVSTGVTAIVSIANIHVAAKRRSDFKLRLAKEEIEQLAKVAERERIARDLHDVLGHTLSVVVLKSELASNLIDRDVERARREIQEVEQIARAALTDVRHAIRGYRAKGLTEELAQARATLETAGVHSECDISEAQLAAGRLSAAQETVIALAIRESVTNVVRHAKARNCRLQLERGVGYYKVIVADDGCGNSQPEGNGLRGMRERIEALGGTLERETVRGTRLLITIPTRPKQGAIA